MNSFLGRSSTLEIFNIVDFLFIIVYSCVHMCNMIERTRVNILVELFIRGRGHGETRY